MAEYNPSKIIKDGNTYNFRDTTKIPLAGSNAISGDLIPATDNSIDIGSSTSNIKMLYTKGIAIDGTQFLPSDYATLSGLSTVATSGSYDDLSNKPTIPTKISDLTNDSGFITSEIDSSGTGWVRFKCGLQICYGVAANNNGISTGVTRHSFPMAFIAAPSVVTAPSAQAGSNVYAVTLIVENGTTFVINSWAIYVNPPILTDAPLASDYVAIGKWK